MRGKGFRVLVEGAKCGITPAYAGKSFHPLSVKLLAVGSPPPMRGKVVFSDAYDNLLKDHPRLCGEKSTACTKSASSPGSPPPMRGKVPRFLCQKKHLRITPAYAGKSGTPFQHLHTATDHPRLCGEKTKKIPKQRYFFHQPASFSFSLQYT